MKVRFLKDTHLDGKLHEKKNAKPVEIDDQLGVQLIKKGYCAEIPEKQERATAEPVGETRGGRR